QRDAHGAAYRRSFSSPSLAPGRSLSMVREQSENRVPLFLRVNIPVQPWPRPLCLAERPAANNPYFVGTYVPQRRAMESRLRDDFAGYFPLCGGVVDDSHSLSGSAPYSRFFLSFCDDSRRAPPCGFNRT